MKVADESIAAIAAAVADYLAAKQGTPENHKKAKEVVEVLIAQVVEPELAALRAREEKTLAVVESIKVENQALKRAMEIMQAAHVEALANLLVKQSAS